MGKLIQQAIFGEALVAAIIAALTICVGFDFNPVHIAGNYGEMIITTISNAFPIQPDSAFYFDPVKAFKDNLALILVFDLILNAITVLIAWVSGWGTRIALVGGYLGGFLIIYGIFNGNEILVAGIIIATIGNISAIVTRDENIRSNNYY